MPRPRRRGETCRVVCEQPDAVTYVERQSCDSPRSSVAITIAVEDRVDSSCVSSPYRRVPEPTRGSSQMSSRWDTHLNSPFNMDETQLAGLKRFSS